MAYSYNYNHPLNNSFLLPATFCKCIMCWHLKLSLEKVLIFSCALLWCEFSKWNIHKCSSTSVAQKEEDIFGRPWNMFCQSHSDTKDLLILFGKLLNITVLSMYLSKPILGQEHCRHIGISMSELAGRFRQLSWSNFSDLKWNCRLVFELIMQLYVVGKRHERRRSVLGFIIPLCPLSLKKRWRDHKGFICYFTRAPRYPCETFLWIAGAVDTSPTCL